MSGGMKLWCEGYQPFDNFGANTSWFGAGSFKLPSGQMIQTHAVYQAPTNSNPDRIRVYEAVGTGVSLQEAQRAAEGHAVAAVRAHGCTMGSQQDAKTNPIHIVTPLGIPAPWQWNGYWLCETTMTCVRQAGTQDAAVVTPPNVTRPSGRPAGNATRPSGRPSRRKPQRRPAFGAQAQIPFDTAAADAGRPFRFCLPSAALADYGLDPCVWFNTIIPFWYKGHRQLLFCGTTGSPDPAQLAAAQGYGQAQFNFQIFSWPSLPSTAGYPIYGVVASRVASDPSRATRPSGRPTGQRQAQRRPAFGGSLTDLYDKYVHWDGQRWVVAAVDGGDPRRYRAPYKDGRPGYVFGPLSYVNDVAYNYKNKRDALQMARRIWPEDWSFGDADFGAQAQIPFDTAAADAGQPFRFCLPPGVTASVGYSSSCVWFNKPMPVPSTPGRRPEIDVWVTEGSPPVQQTVAQHGYPADMSLNFVVYNNAVGFPGYNGWPEGYAISCLRGTVPYEMRPSGRPAGRSTRPSGRPTGQPARRRRR